MNAVRDTRTLADVVTFIGMQDDDALMRVKDALIQVTAEQSLSWQIPYCSMRQGFKRMSADYALPCQSKGHCWGRGISVTVQL